MAFFGKGVVVAVSFCSKKDFLEAQEDVVFKSSFERFADLAKEGSNSKWLLDSSRNMGNYLGLPKNF